MIARTYLLFFLAGSLAVAQTRYDVFIRVSGVDSLDASYFVPNQFPPLSGYPAILFVHGFGLDKNSDTANCRVYAGSGFITLCYSVRGHGNSSGVSMIMSTPERNDLATVIEFMKQLPNTDTSHIGISGGSQGGLHGLWATTDHLPVAAISADVIVPRWASDMLMNGAIRRTLILLLNGHAVRYNGVRDTLWNLIRSDSYDDFKAQFTPERDLDTAVLNARALPTLRLLKWQDHYFAAGDGITAFNDYAGPKRLHLGTRGHFSDQVNTEKPYQDSLVTRWFDYFLRNRQNGILDEARYSYAYSSLPMDSAGFFAWTRTQSAVWPPTGIEPVRYYLSPDSALTYTSPDVSVDSFRLENRYLDSTYTFDTGYIEGFQGSRFDGIIPQHRLVFESPSLSHEVYWIGTPKMKLFVRSDDAVFPLHAQVYEVDSIGAKYFINRINFTARHWLPGAAGIVEVDGIPHAHRFARGSKIRIELTNIDKTNRLQLGSYPFVLPLFHNASVTIFADASRPSYVELPLLGTPTSVYDQPQNQPVSFVLYQNFPNPFNPATKIRYSLPSEARVALEIFDLLGRHVVTLVDEKQEVGFQEIAWDASKIASGVYFYRIIAQAVNEKNTYYAMRKMVLLH